MYCAIIARILLYEKDCGDTVPTISGTFILLQNQLSCHCRNNFADTVCVISQTPSDQSLQRRNCERSQNPGFSPSRDFPIITDTFIILSLNCDNRWVICYTNESIGRAVSGPYPPGEDWLFRPFSGPFVLKNQCLICLVNVRFMSRLSWFFRAPLHWWLSVTLLPKLSTHWVDNCLDTAGTISGFRCEDR